MLAAAHCQIGRGYPQVRRFRHTKSILTLQRNGLLDRPGWRRRGYLHRTAASSNLPAL